MLCCCQETTQICRESHARAAARNPSLRNAFSQTAILIRTRLAVFYGTEVSVPSNTSSLALLQLWSFMDFFFVWFCLPDFALADTKSFQSGSGRCTSSRDAAGRFPSRFRSSPSPAPPGTPQPATARLRSASRNPQIPVPASETICRGLGKFSRILLVL